MKFNCGKSRQVVTKQNKTSVLEKIRQYREKWEPIFTWLPVRLSDNDCRWLERVERRYPHAGVSYNGCSPLGDDLLEEWANKARFLVLGKPEYRAIKS